MTAVCRKISGKERTKKNGDALCRNVETKKPLGHNLPGSKLKKQLFPSEKEPMNEHPVVLIVWFGGVLLGLVLWSSRSPTRFQNTS